MSGSSPSAPAFSPPPVAGFGEIFIDRVSVSGKYVKNDLPIYNPLLHRMVLENNLRLFLIAFYFWFTILPDQNTNYVHFIQLFNLQAYFYIKIFLCVAEVATTVIYIVL